MILLLLHSHPLLKTRLKDEAVSLLNSEILSPLKNQVFHHLLIIHNFLFIVKSPPGLEALARLLKKGIKEWTIILIDRLGPLKCLRLS